MQQHDRACIVARPLVAHVHRHAVDVEEDRGRTAPARPQLGDAAVRHPVHRNEDGTRDHHSEKHEAGDEQQHSHRVPFRSIAAMLSDVCLPFDDFNAARVKLEICVQKLGQNRGG